jgi:hypothetical protein
MNNSFIQVFQTSLYGTEILHSSLGVSHTVNLLIISMLMWLLLTLEDVHSTTDNIIWLWYYDKQGCIQSEGLNFVQDLPSFLMLLYMFQHMMLEQWGLNVNLDVQVRKAHEGSLKRGGYNSEVEVPTKWDMMDDWFNAAHPSLETCVTLYFWARQRNCHYCSLQPGPWWRCHCQDLLAWGGTHEQGWYHSQGKVMVIKTSHLIFLRSLPARTFNAGQGTFEVHLALKIANDNFHSPVYCVLSSSLFSNLSQTFLEKNLFMPGLNVFIVSVPEC